MAANDTISFADFDPVTGAPTINGFAVDDQGIITNESEPGYVNGTRMTWENGALAPVIVQAVKNGNFLVISFTCRGDPEFNNTDAVVVALRPSHASMDHTTARRLDIFPVFHPLGADEADAGGNASGAGYDTPPGIPVGENYFIRTDHRARRIDFWRGIGPATGVATTPTQDLWQAYTPASYTVANPASQPYHVRVRSWKPPVAGPPDECAWSIELKLPLNIATGGADWINLNDGFGLYFSVIRVQPPSTPTVAQFRFPQEVAGNLLTGTLNTKLKIESAWYGKAFIPSLQVPAGSNLGQGVRFAVGPMGTLLFGRRPEASAAGTAVNHQISRVNDNDLVATVDNTHPSNPANNVTAEFRFANWGLGPAGFAAWKIPTGMAAVSTANLAAGATGVELIGNWPAASVPAGYAPPNQHQCMWVQLTSSSTVNFVQSSARKNMDFVSFSAVEREAEVSGVGYPAPAGGSNHDFLLFTRARKIPIPKRGLASNAVVEGGNDVVYLWITEGYRKTESTLTIEGTTYDVLDDGPGAFGYVGTHVGAADSLKWQLTGPGLQHRGNGVYSIPVPHNSAVRINTRVWTDAPGTRGGSVDPIGGGPDRPDGPAGPGGPAGPTIGGLPWWVWLLLLLILIIILLLLM